MDDTLTVSDLLEYGEDEWVDMPVEGFLTNAKPGQGKRPATCTLSDSDGTSIHCSIFAVQSLARYSQQWVILAGQGIKRTAYNGKPQLTIGDKATLQVSGNSAPTPKKPVRSANRPPPKGNPGSNADAFDKRLRRFALGYAHCYQMALKISDKVGGWAPEQTQACTAALFIQMDRAGMLDVSVKMPPLPEEPAAEPPAEPEPEEVPPENDQDEIPF